MLSLFFREGGCGIQKSNNRYSSLESKIVKQHPVVR